MDIQVLQEELAKAISIASRFSSTRVQLPVLANILLEVTKNKLIVSATNLEISVSYSLGAKVEKEGSITIPSRVISELISNLKSGQINLKAEKEILEINSSDFESKLSGMNASDFPAVPKEIGSGGIVIPAEKFQKALGKVLFSVSSDETRPVLTGVLMIVKKGELVMVSTDGFRLSREKIKIEEKGEEEKRFIIPKSILSEILRIQGDENIEFLYKKMDSQVVFATSSVTLSSRVIEGEFPDFEKIIPKDTKIKINADKYEFARTVKLASVFAKDSANVVKLQISKGDVEIVAESQQYGSQKGKFDIKGEGVGGTDKFQIAFNYRFLEEFLSACESEDVQAEFSDPNSPSLFLDSKDENFIHIIMPVRLQS